VTDRESNPRLLACMSGDSTTRLKRSAVMSSPGIHRLIYRDICVERGASYAACAAHNRGCARGLTAQTLEQVPLHVAPVNPIVLTLPPLTVLNPLLLLGGVVPGVGSVEAVPTAAHMLEQG